MFTELSKKLLSIVTVLCFLYVSVCAQTIEAAVEAVRNGGPIKVNLQDFAINLGAGRVTDLWCPQQNSQTTSPRKIVVNIQDLHCNPEVQRNIAKILLDLDTKYGISAVYVEGGYGDIDTSWLSGIQDAQRKNKILESLIMAGRLTGGEYYSVVSGKTNVLKGLENEQTHKKNIARLSRLLDRKEFFARQLALLDKDLESMQLRHFTLQNKRFCRLIEKYRQGKIDSDKYYQLLAKYVARINDDKDRFNTLYSIQLDNYPNIRTYLELSALGKHIRHKKAARELRSFVQQLKEKIPFSLYTQLLRKTDNFQKMDELSVYLAEVSSKLDLPLENRYPDLALFFKYVEKSRQLNPLQLLAEEKKLVREIRIGFSENKSELDVSFLTDFYACFKDYLHSEITADDYRYFTREYDTFRATWGKYVFVNRLNDLSDDLALLDSYYKTNCVRNEYFLQNIRAVADAQAPEQGKECLTLENLHQQSIPALLKDSGFIVLVTGGFHTEGLKSLFRERDIPYMTITPNVASGTGFSDMVYRNMIQEQAKVLTNALGPGLLAQAAAVYRYKVALETLEGDELQAMFKALERTTGISLKEYNKASGKAVLSNGARLTLSKNTGKVERIDNIPGLTAALDAALQALSAVERTAQAAIFGDILDLFIVASETAVRNGYMTGDGPSYSVANDPQLNNERYIAGIPAEIFDNFSPELQDAVRERTKRIQALQKTAEQQPLVEAALATELLRHLLASLHPVSSPSQLQKKRSRGPVQRSERITSRIREGLLSLWKRRTEGSPANRDAGLMGKYEVLSKPRFVKGEGNAGKVSARVRSIHTGIELDVEIAAKLKPLGTRLLMLQKRLTDPAALGMVNAFAETGQDYFIELEDNTYDIYGMGGVEIEGMDAPSIAIADFLIDNDVALFHEIAEGYLAEKGLEDLLLPDTIRDFVKTWIREKNGDLPLDWSDLNKDLIFASDITPFMSALKQYVIENDQAGLAQFTKQNPQFKLLTGTLESAYINDVYLPKLRILIEYTHLKKSDQALFHHLFLRGGGRKTWTIYKLSRFTGNENIATTLEQLLIGVNRYVYRRGEHFNGALQGFQDRVFGQQRNQELTRTIQTRNIAKHSVQPVPPLPAAVAARNNEERQWYIADQGTRRRLLRETRTENMIIEDTDTGLAAVKDELNGIFHKILGAAGAVLRENGQGYLAEDLEKTELLIIDSDDANAYTYPHFGFVVITTGLLKELAKNELDGKNALTRDAVAFVLAHEVVHVLQARKELYEGTAKVIDSPVDLKTKNYAKEKDADLRALGVLNKAGFSVPTATNFFEMAAAQRKEGKSFFTFLDDHAPLSERIAYITRELRNSNWKKNTKAEATAFGAETFRQLVSGKSHLRKRLQELGQLNSLEALSEFIRTATTIRELETVLFYSMMVLKLAYILKIEQDIDIPALARQRLNELENVSAADKALALALAGLSAFTVKRFVNMKEELKLENSTGKRSARKITDEDFITDEEYLQLRGSFAASFREMSLDELIGLLDTLHAPDMPQNIHGLAELLKAMNTKRHLFQLYLLLLTQSIIDKSKDLPPENAIALLRFSLLKSKEFPPNSGFPIDNIIELTVDSMRRAGREQEFITTLLDIPEALGDRNAVQYILEAFLKDPENEDILRTFQASAEFRTLMTELYIEALQHGTAAVKEGELEIQLKQAVRLFRFSEPQLAQLFKDLSARKDLDQLTRLKIIKLLVEENIEVNASFEKTKSPRGSPLSLEMKLLLFGDTRLDAGSEQFIRENAAVALREAGIDAGANTMELHTAALIFFFDSGAIMDPFEFNETVRRETKRAYLSNTAALADLSTLARFLNSDYLYRKQYAAGIPDHFDEKSLTDINAAKNMAAAAADEMIAYDKFYTPKTWAEYLGYANAMVYFAITGQRDNLQKLENIEKGGTPFDLFVDVFNMKAIKPETGITGSEPGTEYDYAVEEKERIRASDLVTLYEQRIREILFGFPKYFDRRFFNRNNTPETEIFQYLLRSEKSFDTLLQEGVSLLPPSVFRDYWLLYLLAREIRKIDPSFTLRDRIELQDIKKLLLKREKKGRDNAAIYDRIMKVSEYFVQDERIDYINSALLSYWMDKRKGKRATGIGVSDHSNWFKMMASYNDVSSSDETPEIFTPFQRLLLKVKELIALVSGQVPKRLRPLLVTVLYVFLNVAFYAADHGSDAVKTRYNDLVKRVVDMRYFGDPLDVHIARIALNNYFKEKLLAGIYNSAHFSSVLRWSLILSSRILNRSAKIDVFYFDFQGKLTHPDTAVPDLAEKALAGFINDPGIPFDQKKDKMVALFKRKSPLRDKYLEMLAEQALKDNDRALVKSSLDELLELFHNSYLRDRYAMIAFQITRQVNPAVQWHWSEYGHFLKENNFAAIKNAHLEFIKNNAGLAAAYFEAGYVRDDLLLALIEETMTEEEYAYVKKWLYKDGNNYLQDKEMEQKLFTEDKLSLMLKDLDPRGKSDLVLWILGAQKKPLALVEIEEFFGISLDRLKDSFGSKFELDFPVPGDALDLSGVGRSAKKEFIRKMFSGNNGILSDDAAFNDFMERMFLKVAPADRRSRAKIKKIMDSILDKSTPERKLEIVQSLSVVMSDVLEGSNKPEAEIIARFFESLGLIGVKSAQVLAHSYDIALPDDIREALLTLSSTAEPLSKMVAFESIRSVYPDGDFDRRFEYIGRRLGSASIKVVYAARAIDETTGEPAANEHVFKIKRPEVAQKSQEDLQTLTRVLEDLRTRGFFIPGGLEKRISGAIDEDADFDKEKDNTEEFDRQFQNLSYTMKNGTRVRIKVAKILHVEKNVIMETELADGVPFENEQEILRQKVLGSKQELDEVKQILFAALMWEVFDQRFYLADPHGGNFFISRNKNDGTVELILVDAGSAEDIRNRDVDPLKMFESIVNLSLNKRFKPAAEYLYFSVFFAKTGYLRNTFKRGLFGIGAVRDIGRTIWKYQKSIPRRSNGRPYKSPDEYLLHVIVNGVVNRALAPFSTALAPLIKASEALGMTTRQRSTKTMIHHLIDHEMLSDALKNTSSDQEFENVFITAIPHGYQFTDAQPKNTGITITVMGGTLRLFTLDGKIYYLQPAAQGVVLSRELFAEGAAQVIRYLNGNDRLNGKVAEKERSAPILIVDHVGVDGLRNKLSDAWMNRVDIIDRREFAAEGGTADLKGEFRKRRIIRNAGMAAVGRNNILKLDIRHIRELPNALKLYNNIHNGQFMLDTDLMKDAVQNSKTEKLLSGIIADAREQGNYVYGRHAIDGSVSNGKAMEQIRQLFRMGFSGLALDLSNMDGRSAAALLEQLEGYSIIAVTMPGGEIRQNSIVPVNSISDVKDLPAERVLEVTFPLGLPPEQLRAFSEALAHTPNPKIFNDSNIQQLIISDPDYTDKVGLTSLLDFIAAVGAEFIRTPQQALNLGYSWDAADLPRLSNEQIRLLADGNIAAAGIDPALAIYREYTSLAGEDLQRPFLQGIAGKILIMQRLAATPGLAADYASGRYVFRDHAWEEMLGLALLRQLDITSTESETVPEQETMHSFLARKFISLRAGSKEPKEINAVADILLQDLISNYNLKKNAGKKQGTVDIKSVERILSAA